MSLNYDLRNCNNLSDEDRNNCFFVCSSLMVIGVNGITEENLADVVLKTRMLYLHRDDAMYSTANLARVFLPYVGITTNVSTVPKQKGRNNVFDAATRDVKMIIREIKNNNNNEEA